MIPKVLCSDVIESLLIKITNKNVYKIDINMKNKLQIIYSNFYFYWKSLQKDWITANEKNKLHQNIKIKEY